MEHKYKNENNKDILIIPFLLSVLGIGYTLGINLDFVSQITIVVFFIIFIMIVKSDWMNADYTVIKALSFYSIMILTGMIISDIVYYFMWYEGVINWINPFVPN